MKKYNYSYNRMPITKEDFESVVPDGWEDECEANDGTYSYGYYRATERDE